MCAIVGVSGTSDAAKIVALGLHALQHRGQESAGVCSDDGNRQHCFRELGLALDVLTEDHLRKLPGEVSIGHLRYSTAGESTLCNAQPFSISCNKGRISVVHNGNITNAPKLRAKLDSEGSIFQATSDTEIILHLLAKSAKTEFAEALIETLCQLEGAFSLLFLVNGKLFAVRDTHGFRPLVIGQMSDDTGSIVFASETCALDLIGATYLREVEPGEIVTVTGHEVTSVQYAPKQPTAQCVFEPIYFSKPDSVTFGHSVYRMRERIGRLLATRCPVQADYVVPVPDSGVVAAVGFAEASGIPYKPLLMRNHYVGRTFIEPKQAVRDLSVRLKLNPVQAMIEGMRIVLVDDSLVRGTTMQKVVSMIRKAGAAEVHVRISCPPTISPCFYGMDTPTFKELIAFRMTVNEIRQFINADTLEYLPMEGLRDAVGDYENYCYSCFDGNYPTDVSQLIQIG